MGDAPMYDLMLGALHYPFEPIHIGITAENVAAGEKITREMQDDRAP
jgi:acetyl-CoA C-acetyltransferase